MKRDFSVGDMVMCKSSGVIGTVLRFYMPTACAEQTMVRTMDGREYHAPTSEWVKDQARDDRGAPEGTDHVVRFEYQNEKNPRMYFSRQMALAKRKWMSSPP